jgi:citrate/tricarballylate utilization protein
VLTKAVMKPGALVRSVDDPHAMSKDVTGDALVAEGARLMQICNSCRYCEGYCAVFPAMERRLDFTKADINYLANLCHNCGECYYACQFAPPHEFAVNVPATFARVRRQSYAEYAWPAPLAGWFQRAGAFAALMTVVAFVVLFAIAITTFGDKGGLFNYTAGDGNFYALMPHGLMAGLFGAVGLFVAAAFVIGFGRFWRDVGESPGEWAKPFALAGALHDALSLKYLSSEGAGCTYPGEEHSHARRIFHHFTFYGFMLCFAATVLGTIYHYAFGWVAPYGYTSLPVLLGTIGGVGLIVGPIGLLALKKRQDPDTKVDEQRGMDVAFIHLLIAVSVTGLALLFFRETRALGFLLVVHLATVLALFLTLPYGKFVHGLYRFAALAKYALERRRPTHNVGGDA